MDMEEYILRWNDHGVSFFALAEDLLHQELLTDISIWCGDRVFDAHKLVLCACSPLFKAMLTRPGSSRLRSRTPDHQPVVFLKDVSPVHFERLLQFMYCGEVRVPNNELEDLLATATSLSVRGLANAHERCSNGNNPATLPPTVSGLPVIHQGHQYGSLPPPPTESMPQTPTNLVLNETSEVEKAVASRVETPPPAQPPKKRRLSRDSENQLMSPLSPLDINRLAEKSQSASSIHSQHLSWGRAIKEEDEAVSPPPQPELVPLIEPSPLKAASNLLEAEAVAAAAAATAQQRLIQQPPPSVKPVSASTPVPTATSGPSFSVAKAAATMRKTGTCFFCKKSFLKNKQLMNHVCPKKPRGGNGGSGPTSAASTSTNLYRTASSPAT